MFRKMRRAEKKAIPNENRLRLIEYDLYKSCLKGQLF